MSKSRLLFMLLCLFTMFSFKINVYADLKDDVKSKSCEELISSGVIDKSNANLLMTPPYDVNCIYYHSVGNSCNIMQLSYDSTSLEYKYDALTPNSRIGKALQPFLSHELITDDWTVPVVGITKFRKFEKNDLSQYRGLCPINVEFAAGMDVGFGCTPNALGENGLVVNCTSFVINSESPNMKRLYATSVNLDIPSLIVPKDDNLEPQSCKEMLGETGVGIIKSAFNVFRIMIPVVLLVLGSLDFAQAVFAQDEGGIKKAQGKFIKRLIVAVIILLTPNILRLILTLANSAFGDVVDVDLCGILE